MDPTIKRLSDKQVDSERRTGAIIALTVAVGKINQIYIGHLSDDQKVVAEEIKDLAVDRLLNMISETPDTTKRFPWTH